jgi:hypothetical protein
MNLTDKRKRDAVWIIDWSRNMEAYGMGYSQYEKYRHRHGRTPPKAGSGKGRTSPRHRGSPSSTKGSAA